MEPHYTNMQKITWGTLDKTGDTSEYAKRVTEAFISSVTLLQGVMSQNIYLVFINRMAAFIPESFLNHIYKIKKLNEIGAQQLLLDVSEIKKQLLKMIQIQPAYEQRMIDSFCSGVNKEIAKIEIRLKVLGYPLENIEEAYGILIQDPNREDYEKILLLKGARKSDLPNYKLKITKQ